MSLARPSDNLIIMMNHPQENNLVLIAFGGDGAIQASEDDTTHSGVEATDVSADPVNEFTTETDENIYCAQWRDIGKLVTENDELVKENDELVKENDELVKENDELVKANDEQAQYIQQLVKDHEVQRQKFAAAVGSHRRDLAQKAIESATLVVHFAEARKAVQYGLSLLQEAGGNESLI